SLATPHIVVSILYLCYFFFRATATTELYTLSLHDALPISASSCAGRLALAVPMSSILSSFSTTSATSIPRTTSPDSREGGKDRTDRKSTRLNSSHVAISYAVFCLKKKILSSTFTTTILNRP